MEGAGFHVQCIVRRLRPIERTRPTVVAVLEAGVGSVQLRDEAASMSAMIRALKDTPAWSRERLAINGEPKVAGEFGLPWLHLPAHWLSQTPPFGRFARIGMSVHSLDEALEAAALGVDYVTFGHIYSSHTHPGEPARGVEALADIVAQLVIPVLAVGGINHANIGEVAATGCAGAVVISAIADQVNPGQAIAQLLERVAGVQPRVPLPALPRSTKSGNSL